MNMIEVKMSFSSPAEAAAFFAHHAIAQAQGSSAPAAAKVELPKEQAKAKPADKPSASADKPTSTPSTESQSKAASPATSSAGGDEASAGVTYPELQQAVMKVVALGDAGKTELKRILAGFKLDTFKGSAEAIWPEALKQVNAAHAALAAA
jgi:hypothetical protein